MEINKYSFELGVAARIRVSFSCPIKPVPPEAVLHGITLGYGLGYGQMWDVTEPDGTFWVRLLT